MILKLLGCSLILSAGGLSAWTYRRFEKRKLKVLDGWIDLIFYIRTQIDCYLMPLSDILTGADTSLIGGNSHPSASPDLSELYRQSHLFLESESERQIASFIREIGNQYREEQVKRCDYYLCILQEIREKQGADLPGKLRLSAAISFCAALGIAILLW